MSNLNDKFIKSLPTPENKHKIFWDDRLIGLGIRITNNNTRSFVLRYVINGRERKYTIGGYPELSCTAAKEMATKLKGEVIKGHDPLDEKKIMSNMPTFKEFSVDFLKAKERILRKSTLEDYRKYFLEGHIFPKFSSRKIDSITKKEIEMFHASFAKTPRMGNRTLQLLGVMFNTAVSWGIVEKNPIQGIKKFSEQKRERYLSQEEVLHLMKALDTEVDQTNSNIVRLILLTGSRKSEVLSARWQDFNFFFDEKKKKWIGVWTKPAFLTKQNKSSRIPLNQWTIDILRSMERRSDFLFPNDQTGKHTLDIKRFWKKICLKSGIKNARIHDLRHTFASILISKGVPLEVIMPLLGHANIKTTQRYSHLLDENLKQATEKLDSVVFKKPLDQ